MNNEQIKYWEQLNSISLTYQKSLSTLYRKQTGVYYTDLEFTDFMVQKLFEEMDGKFKKDIFSKRFLEPCVGVGNFVFSYLKYIYENYSYTKEQIKELISNIYVCDADQNAIDIFLKDFREFLNIFFDINLDKGFLSNIGGSLIFDIKKESTDITNPSDYFKHKEFDIIMTNPPYKLFKAESKHYADLECYENDRKYYEQIKSEIKKDFYYQGKGSLNLYKLFSEKIVTDYLSKNGYAYLLIPQSILKDKTSTELRTYFIEEMGIRHLCNIDEKSKYVDAKQALSAILLKNEKKQTTIGVINHFGSSDEYEVEVDITQATKNSNNSIISLPEDKMNLLYVMNSCKKISDMKCIVNYRGELDLTINKSSISSTGEIPLIRGRQLSRFKLKDMDMDYPEFVDEKFLRTSNKKQYISSDRIACPQISNMNSKKRLFFSYVPSGKVLGNSCNFISVSSNEYGIDLYFLLGILNSDLYDWYFKVFSSNNHINNYEIDNLPIPNISIKEKQELSRIVKKGLDDNDDNLIARVNNKVNSFFSKYEDVSSDAEIQWLYDIKQAFPKINSKSLFAYKNKGISKQGFIASENITSFDMQVVDAIIEKYLFKERNEVLNHTSFKLSDLDMEMVKSISSGGNWKDIPIEIAKKSKRLMRIRETGGRTTLYGRLDYAKPSYTITTYFNRPGNGTNIHPKLDRVLSVREAARIQSFPDDFYFYGNKKNKLNQIGNAVPPLVAYQIARCIKENVDVQNSLDLFNGAGGMSLGFRCAGYTSVMMNDIDEAALITSKVNSPKTNVFLGDITLEKNREHIIKFSRDKKVDIINGGPPCQGFSTAGFRNLDDPRSKLIYDYVKVIKEVKPKVFVFENVPGLLSHNKGETFKELLDLFSEVGFSVEAKLLDFSDFGVPQKRKRVIIIGTRKDLRVNPMDLFPAPITDTVDSKVSMKDTISDLEEIPLDEKSYYVNSHNSSYIKLMKNKMSLIDYLYEMKNRYRTSQSTGNYEQIKLF